MFANQEPPLVKMIALGLGAQLSSRALCQACVGRGSSWDHTQLHMKIT